MLESGELKQLEDRIVSRIEKAIASLFATRPAPVSGPPPGLLKKRDATKALSIGRTKLDGLISRGELGTRKVGGQILIPYSEVMRLSRPDEKKAGASRRRPPKEYDHAAEAESARAALRALRKKKD